MQQINLYQPLFRHQEKIFSSKAMAQGMLVIVAGLAAFYGYALWHSQGLSGQLDQMEKQHAAAAQRVAALLAPERPKDAELEREVIRLRQELTAKQQVAVLLEKEEVGRTDGFTAHLEGLARQREPQLWLTHITIREAGRHMELNGSTFDPEQVPRYLQRLTDEEALAGIRFRLFTMTRHEQDTRRVDFQLATERSEQQ